MNDNAIRLGCTNLRGILDSKWTIRYESISDILISMFSGVNKCSQGRNIFVIDFGSSQYQKFVISLIRISAEFPAHSDKGKPQPLIEAGPTGIGGTSKHRQGMHEKYLNGTLELSPIQWFNFI